MRPEATETSDTLLGGRVRLLQPARGYRVAIDPVLLAAAVPVRGGERVLDAGLGSGAASLCLAARAPGCAITGVELQPELADLAHRNAALNGLPVEVVNGDLLALPAELHRRSFDQVMTNPPFLDAGRGTLPESTQRRVAHVGASLAAWLDTCLRRLAPGGWLTVIHRTDRLVAMLQAIGGQLGAVHILPLWPAAGVPARRVILRGRKGSRAGSVLQPGLVLHEADGRLTEAAEAVLRHGAALPLPA
jgi:tRNA1(Val) A37 N6-methylase TrmN6